MQPPIQHNNAHSQLANDDRDIYQNFSADMSQNLPLSDTNRHKSNNNN